MGIPRDYTVRIKLESKRGCSRQHFDLLYDHFYTPGMKRGKKSSTGKCLKVSVYWADLHLTLGP